MCLRSTFIDNSFLQAVRVAGTATKLEFTSIESACSFKEGRDHWSFWPLLAE
jgi:hypothetical protein